jgi:hypothetical protein
MDLRLILAVLLWLGLLGLAMLPLLRKTALSDGTWKVNTISFLILLAIALPVWRYRSLMYNGEINVDESQLLAQVMRYQTDPIPWRGVDGGSSGPLNTWVLFWGPLLGLKVNYLTARITSLFCLWSMLAGLALSLGEIVNRRLALLLTFPAVTLILTALNFDYVFFSSEQLPSAIIAWVIYAITLQVKTPNRGRAYIIGLLTGALPFCKIQVGPAAVFLWAVAAAVVIVTLKESKSAIAVLLPQVLGGLTAGILILVPVIVGGAWKDFIDLYIRAAVAYQSPAPGSSGPTWKSFFQLLGGVSEFYAFLLTSVGIAVVFLILAVPHLLNTSIKKRLAVLSVAGFSFIVSYSIYRTGYSFPHYTQLLIVPFTILAAAPAIFAPILSLSATPPRWLAAIAISGIAIFQIPQIISDFKSHKQLLSDWGSGIHPIGEVLQKFAQPGDAMFVWGYAPKYHVASGIAPASRFVQSMGFFIDGLESENDPNSNFRRFISDLEKHKPALFVDAPDEFWFPSPNLPRGVMARHHAFKTLASFISTHYHPVLQVNTTPGHVPIMIYQLNH